MTRSATASPLHNSKTTTDQPPQDMSEYTKSQHIQSPGQLPHSISKNSHTVLLDSEEDVIIADILTRFAGGHDGYPLFVDHEFPVGLSGTNNRKDATNNDKGPKSGQSYLQASQRRSPDPTTLSSSPRLHQNVQPSQSDAGPSVPSYFTWWWWTWTPQLLTSSSSIKSLPSWLIENYQQAIIKWYRPQELSAHPCYFKNDDYGLSSDLTASPPIVNDRKFAIAALAIASKKKLIETVFASSDVENFIRYGIFTCRFYVNGEWKDIICDTLLPLLCERDNTSSTIKSSLLGTTSSEVDEWWLPLLTKAYAKAFGGYSSLENKAISDVLVDMTGGCAEHIIFSSPPVKALIEANRLWDTISGYVLGGDVLLCERRESSPNLFTTPPTSTAAVATPNSAAASSSSKATDAGLREGIDGLLLNHAYPVLGIKRVGKYRFVKLRNPWGRRYTWRGAWSPASHMWDANPDVEIAFQDDPVCGFDRDNNERELWMEWKDIVAFFNEIHVCRLFDSEEFYQYSCKDGWRNKSAAGPYYAPTQAGPSGHGSSAFSPQAHSPSPSTRPQSSSQAANTYQSSQIRGPTTPTFQEDRSGQENSKTLSSQAFLKSGVPNNADSHGNHGRATAMKKKNYALGQGGPGRGRPKSHKAKSFNTTDGKGKEGGDPDGHAEDETDKADRLAFHVQEDGDTSFFNNPQFRLTVTGPIPVEVYISLLQKDENIPGATAYCGAPVAPLPTSSDFPSMDDSTAISKEAEDGKSGSGKDGYETRTGKQVVTDSTGSRRRGPPPGGGSPSRAFPQTDFPDTISMATVDFCLVQQGRHDKARIWDIDITDIVTEASRNDFSLLPVATISLPDGASPVLRTPREVTKSRILLDPKRSYVLIPFTSSPSVEREFVLRVFSSRPVKMEVLSHIHRIYAFGSWARPSSSSSFNTSLTSLAPSSSSAISISSTDTAGGALFSKLTEGKINPKWCQNNQFVLYLTEESAAEERAGRGGSSSVSPTASSGHVQRSQCSRVGRSLTAAENAPPVTTNVKIILKKIDSSPTHDMPTTIVPARSSGTIIPPNQSSMGTATGLSGPGSPASLSAASGSPHHKHSFGLLTKRPSDLRLLSNSNDISFAVGLVVVRPDGATNNVSQNHASVRGGRAGSSKSPSSFHRAVKSSPAQFRSERPGGSAAETTTADGQVSAVSPTKPCITASYCGSGILYDPSDGTPLPDRKLIPSSTEWCRSSSYRDNHIAETTLYNLSREWMPNGLLVVPTLGSAGLQGTYEMELCSDRPVIFKELPLRFSKALDGEWEHGKCDPGCHLHGDESWKRNPRYQLRLSCPPSSYSTSAAAASSIQGQAGGMMKNNHRNHNLSLGKRYRVQILLKRPEKEWQPKCVTDTIGCMIGFYLVRGTRLVRHGGGIYHQGKPWNETPFVPTHEVSTPVNFYLEPRENDDVFTIVPSTFEPGRCGSFIISVVAETEFSLQRVA